MVVSLLNNSTAIHDMAPAAGAVEYDLVRRLGEIVGFDRSRCGGILTHGGSLGNLTGLLAGRRARDLAGKPFAVLVSEQAHYCVERAMYVMNQPRDHVLRVPVDERFRMRADALPEAARQAEERGLPLLGVVATTVTTATGSIDPLEECANFCEQRGLWLHVDGAHGASLALGEEGRRRLGPGLARVDSIVWDAHKMLLTQSLCTALLFRDQRHADEVFQQDASYLFGDARDREVDLDHGLRTIESTKPAIAFRLRALFEIAGTDALGAMVDRQNELAARFNELLSELPAFEPLLERPDANIVCFRLVDTSTGTPLDDEAQDAARDELVGSGEFYITRTRLRGSVWLRCTFMHPDTDEADLLALLDRLSGG